MKRRKYNSPGPNYCWHVDGNEKLKPFDFLIHGAVDGYSRTVLWLYVDTTNNDPKIIARYFVDCVEEVGGCPSLVRTDCETENVVTCITATLPERKKRRVNCFLLGRWLCDAGESLWPYDVLKNLYSLISCQLRLFCVHQFMRTKVFKQNISFLVLLVLENYDEILIPLSPNMKLFSQFFFSAP